MRCRLVADRIVAIAPLAAAGVRHPVFGRRYFVRVAGATMSSLRLTSTSNLSIARVASRAAVRAVSP